MSSLAQQVSASVLRDRVFNERQLSELLGGGNARRYGLVNRALKDGSLIRLKRGVYTLAKAHRSAPVHTFAVAQAIFPLKARWLTMAGFLRPCLSLPA